MLGDKYTTKCADWYDWNDWGGDNRAATVHDNKDWSENKPTGVLNHDGRMIYRVARSIGFLADN